MNAGFHIEKKQHVSNYLVFFIYFMYLVKKKVNIFSLQL